MNLWHKFLDKGVLFTLRRIAANVLFVKHLANRVRRIRQNGPDDQIVIISYWQTWIMPVERSISVSPPSSDMVGDGDNVAQSDAV